MPSLQVTSEIAKQFRSQKTSLGFSPGARPDVYIRHSDNDSRAQVEKLKNQISRMAGFGSIQVLDANAPDPHGTMRDVVNEKCLIYTKVEGLDLSGEKVKLQKKVSWPWRLTIEKRWKNHRKQWSWPEK